MPEPIIETTPVVVPIVEPKPAEPIMPLGKVFTEEYVLSLREESKSHRLGRKQRETQLRTILGLKEEDEITDAAITAYTQSVESKIQTATAKANDRLILAAIRGVEGYDTKLVERLIDRTKLTITEDGEVTGIKEAVEALEKEFPQIKKTADGRGVNPVLPENLTDLQQLETQLLAAQKAGNTGLVIAIKNQIFKLNKK
jgi:hypothetical protein